VKGNSVLIYYRDIWQLREWRPFPSLSLGIRLRKLLYFQLIPPSFSWSSQLFSSMTFVFGYFFRNSTVFHTSDMHTIALCLSYILFKFVTFKCVLWWSPFSYHQAKRVT
jgi:hypothetical protein